MSEKAARRVVYRGRVQGVGFRATAHEIASQFNIAGFVRNQSDGTVELVAIGADAEVRQFLDAISQQMARYIERVDLEALATGDEFHDFRIRY